MGKPLSGAAANPGAHDLPRSWAVDPVGSDVGARDPLKRRAIIGDPRNDENVIVSQLQGLFHRFHNKIAADNPDWDFPDVQRAVRFHYQWVVLNDFLPKIVSAHVLKHVAPHVVNGTNVVVDPPQTKFFQWSEHAYMPLEFSAAAYRFGHSMVRPGYRLSETIPPIAIFEMNPATALTGFREFPDSWAIDWNLFAALEPRDPDNTTRTQFAYKIDTSLVNPLAHLPPFVAVNPNILALRNLLRGWRMRLPSGQDVARAMGIKPLADAEILLGKFTGDPDDTAALVPITSVSPVFADNCPLWTYVLAETLETEFIVPTTKGDRGITTRQARPRRRPHRRGNLRGADDGRQQFVPRAGPAVDPGPEVPAPGQVRPAGVDPRGAFPVGVLPAAARGSDALCAARALTAGRTARSGDFR